MIAVRAAALVRTAHRRNKRTVQRAARAKQAASEFPVESELCAWCCCG